MGNFDLVLYYTKKSSNTKQKLSEYIVIEEDVNFSDNVKKVETKPEFISWSNASKYTIESALENM